MSLPACAPEEAVDARESEAASAVSVQGVASWSSPVQETQRFIGSTRAMDTVQITSEVSSKVIWLGFEDEEAVTAGQELIRLDTRRADADYRSAQSRLERLELSLNRIESAYEAGAANLTELDDIRAAVREAAAEADRARVILDDHVITAPFSGAINSRLVSLGALVQPGDPVAVLNSADPIEVTFAVPETLLSELQTGQPVYASFAAFGKQAFRGELTTTGVEVNPTTRSATVYARLPNPDGLLKPGMFAVVTLVTGVRDDAILVPESALLTEGRRVEVFIVEDDKARRQQVQIARRYPGIVEIADGIASGTKVVTSGLQKLRDGVAVTFSEDQDLAMLGIVPGLPLSEQPITLRKDLRTPTTPTGGG